MQMSPFIIHLPVRDWFVYVLQWLRKQIEDYPVHKAIEESLKWLWRKITAPIQRWLDFWVHNLVVEPFETLLRVSFGVFFLAGVGAVALLVFSHRARAVSAS